MFSATLYDGNNSNDEVYSVPLTLKNDAVAWIDEGVNVFVLSDLLILNPLNPDVLKEPPPNPSSTSTNVIVSHVTSFPEEPVIR